MTAPMAQLPLRAMCGASGPLSRQHGAGRAAEISMAFHARIAGQPEAERLMALLTDEEREEVLSMQRPTTLLLPGDVVLDYESSEKEVELALSGFGSPMAFDDPAALVRGRMDFGWVRQVGSLQIAFVEDVKRSVWTTPEGPESLQLHGYGFAYAKLNDCDGYATGIWAAQEGEHAWSSEMVMFGSERAERIWERIYHAARNDSTRFTTGPHCRGCYARLHCPEYAQPFLHATAGALALPDLGLLAAPDAGQLVVKVQAIIDVAERWLENAKEAVRHGKAEVTQNGKRWALVQEKQPRESFNKERFLREVPNAQSFYERKGEPRASFRWLKQA